MRTRMARLLGVALLILGMSSPALAEENGRREGQGNGWWHAVRTWHGWQGWHRWWDRNGDRGRHLGHAKRNRNAQQPPTNAVGAPEIDPSSAAQGLALLTGGLLVLRGRRRSQTEEDRE